VSWQVVGGAAVALALLVPAGAGLAAQAPVAVAPGSGGAPAVSVSSGGASTDVSPPAEPPSSSGGGGTTTGSGGVSSSSGGGSTGGAPPGTDPCALDDKEEDLKALCMSKCTGGDTLCLRADTGSLACEDAPQTIGAGAELKVLVLGVQAQDCIDTIQVTTFEGRRLESLWEAPEFGGFQNGKEEQQKVAVVKELAVTASSETSVVTLGVRFVRTREGDTPIDRTHLIEIDHGRYFLRVGVLLPIVPDGRQHALATLSPSDGEPTLRLTRDLYVMPALALNAFPFGGKSRGKVFCCGKRPLAELLGVQVAVGFDLSQPPPIFAGGLLEPIAGFAVSGGISFIQADVLNPDAAEGMLLRDPSALPVHREYIPRGYIGLTLSTEIIETLLAARTGLAGKKVQ
jgi:hypothetical protein